MKSSSRARVFFGCAAAALVALGIRAGRAGGNGAGQVTDLSTPLPGMPPVLDPHDIYAADRPGNLSPVVKDYPSRVYVPNSGSDTVDVIDPTTGTLLARIKVGKGPHGLCVYPQPGRYSPGHTGILR
jgi:YVTN family beta-propeller protein